MPGTVLISSFCGVFPMSEPQYLVFVMMDEPNGTKASFGFATGGWTAAPAVGRVIARIAPLLGVRRNDTLRRGKSVRSPQWNHNRRQVLGRWERRQR